MKATPVYTINKIDLSLSLAEAEKALADPRALQGILRQVMEYTKTAPEMDDEMPEPAAVRSTKAAKTTKPRKGRGSDVPVYSCNECPRVFTSEKRLANHIRREHEGDESADED